MSGLHKKDSWPFGLGSPHPPKQQGASITGQNRAIEGWGGLAVSADHISLPWPCLIALSFGHASTSSSLQGNTTAAQYRYLTFYTRKQAPRSILASVVMHWSLRGRQQARHREEKGGRREHYHAFASQLFRHEGGLINGDRAG